MQSTKRKKKPATKDFATSDKLYQKWNLLRFQKSLGSKLYGGYFVVQNCDAGKYVPVKVHLIITCDIKTPTCKSQQQYKLFY